MSSKISVRFIRVHVRCLFYLSRVYTQVSNRHREVYVYEASVKTPNNVVGILGANIVVWRDSN